MTGIVRALLPWLVVVAVILLVWLAIGIGNQVGHGLTEWTVR
jgi:hypothetical protein